MVNTKSYSKANIDVRENKAKKKWENGMVIVLNNRLLSSREEFQ